LGYRIFKGKRNTNQKKLEIEKEETNIDDNDSFQKYGLISTIYIDEFDFNNEETAIWVKYELIFYSNKFACGKVFINTYPPGPFWGKEESIKKQIEKHGEPKKKEYNDTLIIWEKNKLNIELQLSPDYDYPDYLTSFSLTYKNYNFYNAKTLNVYKSLEDTWISGLVSSERNDLQDITKDDEYKVMFFSTDFYMYKISLKNKKMTLEKYNRGLSDAFKQGISDNDENLSIEGPYPYKINKNKIVVTDDKGNIKEYEYSLNKENLTVTIDNIEVTLHRFP